jgi:3-oxoadipate enol-lactonase
MALLQPSRVRRLVLCNTLANYRTDTWRKRLEACLQICLVRTLGLRRTATLISKRLFPHPEQAPKRQRVVDVVGANSPEVYLATMRALIGWHAVDRLGALQARTLIIAAEHDYTPLADKREELRHFPNAEFAVIEGSRHGTPFDATAEFNAHVLRFLAASEDRLQR